MNNLPRQPIARLLQQRAAATPDHVFAVDVGGEAVTCRQLAARSTTVAHWLHYLEVGPGNRVVSALGNSIDHVVLFFACCLAGVVWVPVNPRTRGPALAHMLKTADPQLIVHEDDAERAFEVPARGSAVPRRLSRSEWASATAAKAGTAELREAGQPHDLDALRSVIFTSGTTGPPKGVMVTERMLLAAAAATRLAARCESGDRFLMWEPLHHIGGSQLCVLALLECIRLHVIPGFSASRFWDQVRDWGITKIHYLGGVLDILLKAPERADDAQQPARLAFGAGARPEVWRAFSRRFGVTVHEVYGMTEASSYATLNDEGVIGSVGRALPWFELELVDPHDRQAATGEPGELTVKSREPGLLTPGYLGDPAATRDLIRGERLFTGDLMRRDSRGNYWFVGRRGDAIRRRGENLSAWEIEQALLAHPDIAEAAVIGVKASIGEQDVHAFILRRHDTLDHHALLAWCQDHLGRHQVPRYFSFVKDFPRTPSQRIAKAALDARCAETWDSENPGQTSPET